MPATLDTCLGRLALLSYPAAPGAMVFCLAYPAPAPKDVLEKLLPVVVPDINVGLPDVSTSEPEPTSSSDPETSTSDPLPDSSSDIFVVFYFINFA